MTEPTRPRVIVGIDGSPAGAEAMECAAHEAALREAVLVLAYAGDAGQNIALSTATNNQVVKDSSDYGHQLLADAIASLVESHPAVTVRTKLESVRPTTLLLETAHPGDVLVVGRSRGPGVVQLLLGSVSRRVAAHARCTVIIAGVESADPHAPVVVGISTSAGGHEAMRFACTEARLRHTSVHGIRAWSAHDWSFEGDGYLSEDLWRDSQEALVRAWVERARGEFPDVHIEGELTTLPVFPVLQKASRRAQLLVLGCRRPDSAWLPRLGPIASWLGDNASCPLAIVDQPAETGSVP